MNNLSKILVFLNQLKDNNNKDWMDKNKKVYQESKKIFTTLVEDTILEIGKFDDNIMDLEAKKCIFRLNRDIRFSKDKSPYKLNFGAAMQKEGRKSPYAGYYLHLAPQNQSFLASGMYMPTGDALKKIRQEIDYNQKNFEEILNAPDFKKTFGSLQGEKLKSNPRGYTKDHPAIELLKHKSFVVICSLKDEEVVADRFMKKMLEVFKQAKKFSNFLNEAIAE